MTLAGTTTGQFLLYERHIYVDTGRQAVDNAADGGAVTLAEGGEAVKCSCSITHRMLTFTTAATAAVTTITTAVATLATATAAAAFAA